MMFDDDGTGNTGIEIVRLNKKFDIFMKRFARAEEDIKEVKQNFYRVMHCAFAKYEQGFKRKNEYLEKRKFRGREAIASGVEQELKNRGLTGRMEDPLLSALPGGPDKSKCITNGNQSTENFMSKAITFTKPMGDDESSLGLNLGFNGMGIDEES